MSDTFYERQAKGPVNKEGKKKLKKDWLAEINEVLGKDVDGLDKCTIPTLKTLLGAINAKVH